jgi:16S rRNA (guanine527-N7)-methyltransferase
MQRDSSRSDLINAAATLGVGLDERQIDALLGHLALLVKWNQTYNLTAVRDPSAMLHHHLLDSLAVVAPLNRHLSGLETRAPRLLDVGSGAGFPGLVLAAALPQLEVTCVDAVGKKASFIRQAAAELRLHGVQVVHARVEQLQQTAFDVITSRAFASLVDFTRLTTHLLAPAGCWMAMKAKVPDQEILALPAEIEMFHVEHLQVPGLNAERCLIWMRRFEPRT